MENLKQWADQVLEDIQFAWMQLDIEDGGNMDSAIWQLNRFVKQVPAMSFDDIEAANELAKCRIDLAKANTSNKTKSEEIKKLEERVLDLELQAAGAGTW